MKKKGKFQFRMANSMILSILTIICIAAIGISYFNSGSGISLQTAVGYLVVPMQQGVNSIGGFFSDLTDEKVKLEDAMAQIETLQQENQQLKDTLSTMDEDYAELESLRELFNVKETYRDYEMIYSRIIATDSTNWNNQFTIDKGAKDGITVDMNVINGEGLVGIVTKVAANYSIVTAIIDGTSKVSAMSPETNEQCITEGDTALLTEGKVALNYINKAADIQNGSRIVTSNVSDKYLPGILIGYAEGIKVNDNDLTKAGFLVPAVDFCHLKEVLVITTTKASLLEDSAIEPEPQTEQKGQNE